MKRRNFLGATACSSMASTTLLNTLLSLRQINAQAAATVPSTDPYKAIVCLFLYGGNDSANVLMPRETAAHAKYLASRTAVGIPQTGILPLNALNDNGMQLGIHGSMTGCRDLFAAGKLAMFANLGTLIAPATLTDYNNRTAAIPDNLFSHSDQQMAWQTSAATNNAIFNQTGWGGRMAEAIYSAQQRNSISMLVSLAGNNFFQVGTTMLPFRPGPGGTPTYKLGQSSATKDVTRYTAFRNILNAQYANLMEDAFADLSNKSIIEADTINTALQGTGTFNMIPAGGLGDQFKTIAKLVQASGPLGMTRQIFFVSTGGFDTHGDQIAPHAQLLGGVSAAMKGFQDALDSIGMGSAVTTFTASDFGRTYDSNGRGTDHGWGGHHMVMGGSVIGQKIYGSMPDPDITVSGNPNDTGRGRWLPSISVDQYAATMAKWFGLSDSQIRDVFPSIINFDPNLGFMQAA